MHDSGTVLYIKHKKSLGFQCSKWNHSSKPKSCALKPKSKVLTVINNDLIIQIRAKWWRCYKKKSKLRDENYCKYRFVWIKRLEFIYEPDAVNFFECNNWLKSLDLAGIGPPRLVRKPLPPVCGPSMTMFETWASLNSHWLLSALPRMPLPPTWSRQECLSPLTLKSLDTSPNI